MTATLDPVAGPTSIAIPPTVLLVDDDADMRAILERMLAAIGVREIHQAGSAAVALDVVKRLGERLQVVISDLEMPDVDGMEFLRLLSAVRPGASVVVLSAKDRDILQSVEVMAKAYGLVVLGVVAKPATVAGLREQLARYRPHRWAAVTREAGSITAQDVRQALNRDEITVFFQPKVEVATRRIVGVEALARWQHPAQGLVAPANFIGVAEAHGLMDRLTLDLVGEAAAHAQGWALEGLDLPVSLNVSQSSLANTGFATRVIDAFTSQGLSPNRLIVEVTETVAMTDVAHCLETLTRLRLHGVGLSIDDFGTGHASFEQLSRVPYTELKIDRSFVTGAADQPRRRAFLESSLVIADKLHLTCTAEGVESRSEWHLLEQLGCHAAQGYFIARPMEGAQLVAWARAWNAAQGSGSP